MFLRLFDGAEVLKVAILRREKNGERAARRSLWWEASMVLFVILRLITLDRCKWNTDSKTNGGFIVDE
jgi:hypothetical protein